MSLTSVESAGWTPAGDEGLVVVEGGAAGAPAVVLKLDLRASGGERRALGGGNGGALRVADPDEEGVGAAGERDALEVVGVVGLEGGEEVVREALFPVVGDEAADRVLLARAEAE